MALNGNFSKGLFQVEIPELGPPIRGKVRDNWVIEHGNLKYRLMITTDRQAVHARPVCTIPGKGQLSNLMSAFWFNRTKNIVPNHMISVPHPNILFARQAKVVIPVEVIVRRYMAKSTSRTSIYHHYVQNGRREIYGLEFPEGLQANQEFPMGTIITPTTKAIDGHDQELTDLNAGKMVDNQCGEGVWNQVKNAAYQLFEYARVYSLKKGVILADTKFEFGIDSNGRLMVIDELLTPECSRFWILENYQKRLAEGKNPEPYKDVLLDWLSNNGFDGKAFVPVIDPLTIQSLLEAYTIPYQMITESQLPAPVSDQLLIKQSVLNLIPIL